MLGKHTIAVAGAAFIIFISALIITTFKNQQNTNDIITPTNTSLQEETLKIHTLCGCSEGESNGKTIEVSGYCSNHFLVRLIGEHLYIYSSADTTRPIEIRPIDLGNLTELDKTELVRMTFFETQADLLMFLEDFS